MTGRARLSVDWTRCDARGRCLELLPELVHADDWGFPVMDPDTGGAVPRGLERLAERARASCPTLALRLDRD